MPADSVDRAHRRRLFIEPQACEVLLLCSDGLTNVVGEADIAGFLIEHLRAAVADLDALADGEADIAGFLIEAPALDATAEQLIVQANENSRPDNVTVIVARWVDRRAGRGRA